MLLRRPHQHETLFASACCFHQTHQLRSLLRRLARSWVVSLRDSISHHSLQKASQVPAPNHRSREPCCYARHDASHETSCMHVFTAQPDMHHLEGLRHEDKNGWQRQQPFVPTQTTCGCMHHVDTGLMAARLPSFCPNPASYHLTRHQIIRPGNQYCSRTRRLREFAL
jgi:hypothetical protein